MFIGGIIWPLGNLFFSGGGRGEGYLAHGLLGPCTCACWDQRELKPAIAPCRLHKVVVKGCKVVDALLRALEQVLGRLGQLLGGLHHVELLAHDVVSHDVAVQGPQPCTHQGGGRMVGDAIC